MIPKNFCICKLMKTVIQQFAFGFIFTIHVSNNLLADSFSEGSIVPHMMFLYVFT